SEECETHGDFTNGDNYTAASSKSSGWPSGRAHSGKPEHIPKYRGRRARTRWRCAADSEEGGLCNGERTGVQPDGRRLQARAKCEMVFESSGRDDATRGQEGSLCSSGGRLRAVGQK